jgi:hypothetical protein
MASTSLTWTPSGAGSQQKTTLSMWLKKSVDSNAGYIFEVSDGTNQFIIRESNAQIKFWHWNGSAYQYEAQISPLLRDVNGWYHFVMSIDTTLGTQADRLKCWLNGVSETVTFTSGSMPQNANYIFNKNSQHRWGRADNNYWNGSMSHLHQTDGYCYDASTFGSIDNTTGEWQINVAPTIANYGTNGYFILKDGNSVTDQSPNTNNFTVATGTLTKTEDNPSNVFATMNSLSAGSDMTFGNGNTKIRNDVATWNSGVSTIAMGTGKYYWEVYVHGGGDNNTGVSLSSAYGGTHSEVDAGRVVYSRNGYIYREGLSGQGNYATGVTYGDGDYIGVAFDTENGILTFYKNGTAVTNGSTTDTSFLRTNNEYIVQCGLYNGGEFRFNFGNGAFGSTQLTGTTYQASGIGIFKYQPPTGYTALSTKGLNL